MRLVVRAALTSYLLAAPLIAACGAGESDAASPEDNDQGIEADASMDSSPASPSSFPEAEGPVGAGGADSECTESGVPAAAADGGSGRSTVFDGGGLGGGMGGVGDREPSDGGSPVNPSANGGGDSATGGAAGELSDGGANGGTGGDASPSGASGMAGSRSISSPCPGEPPVANSPCPGEAASASCFYQECAGTGRTHATCSDGAWSVVSSPCSAFACSNGSGSVECGLDQFCIDPIAGDPQPPYCADNECGDGVVGADCACGTPSESASAEGGIILNCSTCGQPVCG
jgi:hypothetical protein